MALLPPQFQKLGDAKLLKQIESDLKVVENRIQEATAQTDSVVDTMSNHLAQAGGKRLRPLLVLLTSHLGSGTNSEVMDAAVVMEVTHLATLYHDDVMDEASTRRGVDAAHVVWGNSIAILTGDLLFARAANIVSHLGTDALQLQAKVFEQLVLGQLHETIGPGEADPLQHYLDVVRDKTGSLIALSARMGALLSGADESFQESLQLYGERVGIAFQLADDLIDIRASKKDSGKVAGTDILAGVPTLPALLLSGYEDAESKQLAADIASASEANIASVLERLRNHPVIAEAEEVTDSWAEMAIDALQALPSGSVKSALEAFARAVVDRKG
ncbi:MAG: geranylgeranyl pyrophosphate synthase [Candidatus Aquiluna sp. XM-24bin5]|nr:MAG: geranylgeranyl pyrophosphate synthase [Candidatus Aquiluna sp. XM-24bin5]